MSAATLGLYHPGSTAVHRMSAGSKLAAMLIAVVAIVLLRQWWQLAIAAGVVALCYAAARIPARVAWTQLRPLKYFIPVLVVLQLWLANWQTAVQICGTIVLAVSIAALVTLTTRVTAMLDALSTVLGPLRRVGVDPERIALLLAVTIRCIPLVAGIVTTVTEARKARGLGFSVVALGAPVVIRSLRAADTLGEALIARGADD
ncbi:MAG: energy-coupling factor transporter transmembrane protein EcfT [Nakamurella sp.]